MSIIIPFDYNGDLETVSLKVYVWTSCKYKGPINCWEIIIMEKDNGNIIYSDNCSNGLTVYYSRCSHNHSNTDVRIIPERNSNINCSNIMYLVKDITIDYDYDNDFDHKYPHKLHLNLINLEICMVI